MRYVILIQLRSGSTRLHRKIFTTINNVPIWERVYLAAKATGVEEIVLAYPRFDQQLNYTHYRVKAMYPWFPCDTPEEDVLGRFKEVAAKLDLTTSDKIIRITSDCALITPEAIMATMDGAEGKEYFYNCIDGYDVEVFTVRALKEADANTQGDDRQHVTKYLIDKYQPYASSIKHRLSIDEEKDLFLVRKVVENE